jgi:predicted transposase/invertase (TIGR01784 family)
LATGTGVALAHQEPDLKNYRPQLFWHAINLLKAKKIKDSQMKNSDGLEKDVGLEEGIELLNDQETTTGPDKLMPRFFDPRNDIAFKKVFVNHPDLTLSFLNSTLRLHGNRTIKKVEFLPTERLPMTAESKKSILDVLCTDEKGSQYIIEVQNKSMLNYIQRIQYYGSHVFAGQLEYAGNYLNLKPVTMLSILNNAIFPHEVNYLSYHHNIEKETQVSYLDDLNYVFIELPKFNKKQEDLETVEDYWIFTLKEGYHLTEVPEHAPEEVKRAYGILEKHTWTRAERLAYEQAKIGLMDDEEAIRTAKIEGKAEVAKELLADGMPLEKVSKVTKLAPEIIAELAREGSEG